jgi:hypothetical protein
MQRQDPFRPSFKRGVIKKPITKTQANSLQNLPGKEALTRWEQVSALSRRHLTGNNRPLNQIFTNLQVLFLLFLS